MISEASFNLDFTLSRFLSFLHRFRYTCPIKKKCSMNEGSKPKQMGYKQYAIHAGHEHNMVELAMQRDAGHAKEMAPVLEALAAARLAEVASLPVL